MNFPLACFSTVENDPGSDVVFSYTFFLCDPSGDGVYHGLVIDIMLQAAV
jgi:hypothetical protein